MNTQLAAGPHHRSSDRRPVNLKRAILVDGRPPARTTTTAARHGAGRPAGTAEQLAYSEWLLAKLTAY